MVLRLFLQWVDRAERSLNDRKKGKKGKKGRMNEGMKEGRLPGTG